MAKPSWEKNATNGLFSPTSTGEYSTWGSIRAVTSATDAQKCKHIRIAYSLSHSAGLVRAYIELARWPESQTPTSAEPGRQDNQIFLQRPIVADSTAVHYGFLRWPGFVVKPGEEIFLGLRLVGADAGTTKFNYSVSWLETVV